MKFSLVYLLQLLTLSSSSTPKFDKYCMSKACVLDAARLIEFASDDEFLQPCDDFTEFALGKFIQFRSMQEDYDKSGFLSDTLAHDLRLEKILKAPLKDEDTKNHKIIKNFFQKCTDEDYIQYKGKLEIYEFLKNKSVPLIDGTNWDPEKVNISAILHYPTMRLEFFLTHNPSRCVDPRDPETTIFCWRYNKIFEYLIKAALKNTEKTRMDYLNRLKEVDYMITCDEALVNASVNHLIHFLEDKVALDSTDGKQIPIIIKVKDIQRVLTPNSNLTLDWLSIINQGFLKHSQLVSEDEEILIEDWNIFAKSLELIETTPVRNMMDVFFLAFLYRYEHVYALKLSELERGVKRDKERFDQCHKFLQTIFAPGISSLFAQKYPLKNLFTKEFVQSAVDEISNQLTSEKDLEIVIKDDVERKFKKLKLQLGIIDEIYDESKMEELYRELDLNGDENLFEATIKLVQHNNRLKNERKNSWFYLTNQLSQLTTIKYLPDVDLLYIPVTYLLYPYFDDHRPRFMNTATLFPEIVLSIIEGLKKYFLVEFRLNYEFNFDSIELAFKNYKNFLNFQEDKKLPGFSLPDEKMFWIAFANTYFLRYQNSIGQLQKHVVDLQYEHFHVWLKARKEFRESFKCEAMNEKEKEEYEMFQRNYSTIYRI